MSNFDLIRLSEAEWHAHESAHQLRADRLTADHMKRRRAGISHPVYDFLFEYYPVRVAHMKKWHPGVGVGLEGNPPHSSWKGYTTINGLTVVDVESLKKKRGSTLSYVSNLLKQTQLNPTHFDCFGLHEWAMVYQTSQPRHTLPLRLGAQGSNKVVESHNIRCTHFDAFRFFTEPAVPLNFQVLTRENQPSCEQPGCLHAMMDLYKWSAKLGPLIPGNLWLDTFELAWDCRVLDMEASPYDCTDYGLGIVPIETAEGKAEYVRRQRELSERGQLLRQQLVAELDRIDRFTLTS
ncbi:3-methyladenine DNA glycosylase [Corynebacterium rouxii]|uniref:3-methyladenine DNA glycosylase n=1 Tax=Corynebacterium rouxii TaxID=2719119 RepID=A0ABU3PME5_9CORY|nr:3-methyladenine DNA glycosylase [Corynebacterium rouxii]MDT9408818.1 3-methyladenine DNA glycosylase [Corynebacterium rouxii]MDT9410998.1 3-methyladenine DNA glycosylase [Corynebacterium rouxii]